MPAMQSWSCCTSVAGGSKAASWSRTSLPMSGPSAVRGSCWAGSSAAKIRPWPQRDCPVRLARHPSLAAAGDRLFVAWQDNRLGNNDVFFRTSPDGGTTFAGSERVDDTGAGRSEQTRPRLAWAAGACYVAWEDSRDGTSDIYLGRRACPVQ